MEQVYTVAQLNRYVKGLFDGNSVLKNISIRGEVSNCKYHSTGHIYFTLKDSAGRIACVMFAGSRRLGLDFVMQDGMSVIVTGSVSVYERDGKYQIYVNRISKEGLGALYERLALLKQALSDEGLFDGVYKKQIPYYCKNVGIVTAETGAAIQDIINISHRRNPYVQLYLYPVPVQGPEAAVKVAEGIRYMDKLNMDVIIVGRGGGSFEDLFAFNEEVVVRAIFECRTAVISAVGHETDTSLSDYVADLRAPTPSAAAELAVRDINEIYKRMKDSAGELLNVLTKKVTGLRYRYELLSTKLSHNTPEELIIQKRQYLMDIEMSFNRIIEDKIAVYRNREHICIEKMKLLSPLQRLSGGYVYARIKDGEILTSVKQISDDDLLEITVKDGKIVAKCNEVYSEE